MKGPIQTYDVGAGWWGLMIDADLRAIENELNSIGQDVENEVSHRDLQNRLRQIVFASRKRAEEILKTGSEDSKRCFFSLSRLHGKLNIFSEARFDELRDKEFFYATNKLLADGISKIAAKLSEEEQSQLRLLAENFGYLEDADNLFFYAKARPIITAIKTHTTFLDQQIAQLRPPSDLRILAWPFLVLTGLVILATLVNTEMSRFEHVVSVVFLTPVFLALRASIKKSAKKISSWESENSARRELLIKRRTLLETKLAEIDMERFEDLDDWYEESIRPLSKGLAMVQQLIPIGHKYQILDRPSIDAEINEAIEWSQLSADQVLQRAGREYPDLAEVFSKERSL